MPARKIAIANRHPRLRLHRRAVIRAIATLDTQFISGAPPSALSSQLTAPPGELSLVFLTDADLAKLHAYFLDDPTPTDVITFEGNPALGTAGEICVSVDAALRHVGLPLVGRPLPAPSRNSRLSPLGPLGSFSTELTLYLVHGWLHLAGYDDLVPAKKRLMRRAETRAMKLLRASNAIPSFSLVGSRSPEEMSRIT